MCQIKVDNQEAELQKQLEYHDEIQESFEDETTTSEKLKIIAGKYMVDVEHVDLYNSYGQIQEPTPKTFLKMKQQEQKLLKEASAEKKEIHQEMTAQFNTNLKK